jgi:protein-tyrosine phosphatase
VKDQDPGAFTDFHSHLVPGVDDGARTLEDTLDSVARFTRLGIRKILTTPHLDGSLTKDPEGLEERLSEVTVAWEEAAAAIGRDFPEVEFKRGHEVMLDVPDVDFSDPRVRLAGTSFVLIEWPRLQVPPGTVQVLERILKEGYKPIIAHPERYIGIDRSAHVIKEWRDVGAHLQVNYASLFGRYGAAARSIAGHILKRGWASYLASDFHGHSSQKIYFREISDRLEEIGASEALGALCVTNPGRILRDEDPLPVPLLPPETGFWAKVKGMINQERA